MALIHEQAIYRSGLSAMSEVLAVDGDLDALAWFEANAPELYTRWRLASERLRSGVAA